MGTDYGVQPYTKNKGKREKFRVIRNLVSNEEETREESKHERPPGTRPNR